MFYNLWCRACPVHDKKKMQLVIKYLILLIRKPQHNKVSNKSWKSTQLVYVTCTNLKTTVCISEKRKHLTKDTKETQKLVLKYKFSSA